MVKEKQAMSRYSHPCPACGASIRPADIPSGDSFPCPACGEWLKYDSKYDLFIHVGSILAGTILTWRMGYRNATFIFVAACITILLWSLGMFLDGIMEAPGFKRIQNGKRKPFDKALSLFVNDKPDGNNRNDP